ncbi:DUF2235 domain-containing protein [Rhodopseudomonas sp. B29]|uniref:DUF2235 domain-containing protein n=1 Tax=Rhodopseudomonas sp. B29 TaxID=95607 RepID=UPI000347C6DB|nr:DUF2235 domain-containing protein [Rhodopseudomonas sp. B29]
MVIIALLPGATMAKNILIFSDGTGQAGGLMPDEKRTNVYKLYRATRCGPDTDNDPLRQVAFYDPGVGSDAPSGGRAVPFWRKIYNIVSGATGLGVTRNIIDCYAAIIELWRPGDRIYLFGFSRGAYTVRCLGGVLALCGVPRSENGRPIDVDPDTANRIAAEAVKKVYQHGASKKQQRFRDQRDDLAAAFRRKYASDVDGHSNEVPYFIGVFDTVAALGASWPKMLGATVLVLPLLLGALAGIAWLASLAFGSFGAWYTALIIVSAAALLVAYLWTHVKWALGTRDPWWKTLHVIAWRLKFYDKNLNDRVAYARHALSIDERRKDFKRVEWANSKTVAARSGQPGNWFEQIWFAGVHADIGGGYIENESRLSDITLEWMSNEALRLPHPILIDRAYLRPRPSAAGMQHDEARHGMMGLPILRWPTEPRTIPDGAFLHASVFERLALPEVQNYGTYERYDPCSLHGIHPHRYDPLPPPSAPRCADEPADDDKQ